MMMNTLFPLPPEVAKEPAAPQPKRQWFIVRTDENGEWAYWRSHDNGLVQYVAMNDIGRCKPKRYKTHSGALLKARELTRESRSGVVYSVREWVA